MGRTRRPVNSASDAGRDWAVRTGRPFGPTGPFGPIAAGWYASRTTGRRRERGIGRRDRVRTVGPRSGAGWYTRRPNGRRRCARDQSRTIRRRLVRQPNRRTKKGRGLDRRDRVRAIRAPAGPPAGPTEGRAGWAKRTHERTGSGQGRPGSGPASGRPVVAAPEEGDPVRPKLAPADPPGDDRVLIHDPPRAASSGASKTQIPVLTRPRVGPTRTMTPSVRSRPKRAKCRRKASASAGVSVAAKSSRVHGGRRSTRPSRTSGPRSARRRQRPSEVRIAASPASCSVAPALIAAL